MRDSEVTGFGAGSQPASSDEGGKISLACEGDYWRQSREKLHATCLGSE